MTDPAPGGAAPEPVTETWTYGGIRAGKDQEVARLARRRQRRHWFARTGSRMAVGSHYTAQVTRRDGGDISLHGTPEYAGSQACRETRAALWTEHTLAQTRIESLRASGTPPAAMPWTRRSPRSWNWPPAAHRRAARRPRRLRHPQAPQRLEHPVTPGGGHTKRENHHATISAYLVSGAFGHRAGCRDCEKEARRSDSAGTAEEYASRTEVIVGLWSDIIAENPEVYGGPGGLASLEAETIFLPCTSGLPGTSPAGDGGQPGEAAAGRLGRRTRPEAGDLDDLVHDGYRRQASEVNNGGRALRSGSWPGGGLGTWPWPRGSTTKIFGQSKKKGFRFALKPVTIWRLASFDRPVFAGRLLIKIIEIKEETKDDP